MLHNQIMILDNLTVWAWHHG